MASKGANYWMDMSKEAFANRLRITPMDHEITVVEKADFLYTYLFARNVDPRRVNRIRAQEAERLIAVWDAQHPDVHLPPRQATAARLRDRGLQLGPISAERYVAAFCHELQMDTPLTLAAVDHRARWLAETLGSWVELPASGLANDQRAHLRDAVARVGHDGLAASIHDHVIAAYPARTRALELPPAVR